MSDAPIELAIIAAMDGEVRNTVRGCSSERLGAASQRIRCWRKGSVAVITVGMGFDRAYRGTKVVIETLNPKMVTSVGFAGSLAANIGVGTVIVPAEVVSSTTGKRFQTAGGDGTVISVASVVGSSEKLDLARHYGGLAVDMEAAGVAQAASEAGIEFLAVKSISDALNDRMDFIQRFMEPSNFRIGPFLAYIVLHPSVWGDVKRLAVNSSIAGKSLNEAISRLIEDKEEFISVNSLRSSKEV